MKCEVMMSRVLAQRLLNTKGTEFKYIKDNQETIYLKVMEDNKEQLDDILNEYPHLKIYYKGAYYQPKSK